MKDKSNDFISIINKKNIILFSVILGLLFPFTTWIFELIVLDLKFSISNLRHIHSINKVLYVVDVVPIVLGGLGYFFGNKIDHQFKNNQLLFLNQEHNFNALLNFEFGAIRQHKSQR